MARGQSRAAPSPPRQAPAGKEMTADRTTCVFIHLITLQRPTLSQSISLSVLMPNDGDKPDPLTNPSIAL